MISRRIVDLSSTSDKNREKMANESYVKSSSGILKGLEFVSKIDSVFLLVCLTDCLTNYPSNCLSFCLTV